MGLLRLDSKPWSRQCLVASPKCWRIFGAPTSQAPHHSGQHGRQLLYHVRNNASTTLTFVCGQHPASGCRGSRYDALRRRLFFSWTALPAGVMHQLCALLEKAPKHTSMHCLRVLGRTLDSWYNSRGLHSFKSNANCGFKAKVTSLTQLNSFQNGHARP